MPPPGLLPSTSSSSVVTRTRSTVFSGGTVRRPCPFHPERVFGPYHELLLMRRKGGLPRMTAPITDLEGGRAFGEMVPGGCLEKDDRADSIRPATGSSTTLWRVTPRSSRKGRAPRRKAPPRRVSKSSSAAEGISPPAASGRGSPGSVWCSLFEFSIHCRVQFRGGGNELLFSHHEREQIRLQSRKGRFQRVVALPGDAPFELGHLPNYLPGVCRMRSMIVSRGAAICQSCVTRGIKPLLSVAQTDEAAYRPSWSACRPSHARPQA